MKCPECGADSLSLIGLEPNGDLMYRCPNHQKAYGPHHFSYFSAPASDLRRMYRSDQASVPRSTMEPRLRLHYIETACEALLKNTVETDYVVIQSGNDWCEGVQFMVRDGTIVADVNTRQWDPCEVCHNRPLEPDAISALETMGFIGGAPRRNFRRIGVSPVPHELALLADELFRAAYGEPSDFAVGVRFRHGDVAQAFLAEVAKESCEDLIPTAESEGTTALATPSAVEETG